MTWWTKFWILSLSMYVSIEMSVNTSEIENKTAKIIRTLDYDDFSDLNETEEFQNYTLYVVDMLTNTTFKFREDDDVEGFFDNLQNNEVKDDDTEDPPLRPHDIDVLLSGGRTESFCPTLNTCASKLQSYEKNYCCMPCECYDKCYKSGSCCNFVSMDIKVERGRREECVVPSLGDSSMYIGSSADSLIYSCDVNADVEVIRKCQQTDDVNVLDQLIPVYSHMSSKTYKNIHCARCNNETNDFFGGPFKPVMPWESHLICKNELLLIKQLEHIFTDAGNIVSKLNGTKGCYLHWYADIKPDSCIKPNNVINACNDPSFEDARIRRFCRRDPYSPVKGLFGIYANVFCLICNEGLKSLNETCKSQFTDIHESFYDIRENASRVSLRLPQNVVDVIAESTEGLPLPVTNFLRNEFVKMCPITAMRIEGTCVAVIKDLRGIGLDFLFRMVFPKRSGLFLSNEYILLNVRSFAQGGNTPHLCVERVLDRYDENDKTIVVVQLTRMIWDFVDIRNEYQSFIQNLESYNEEAKSYTTPLVAEIVRSPLELISDGPVSFAVYTNRFVSHDCGRAVAMTDMQFCYTFLFQNVLQIDDGLIEVNGVRFTAGEYLMKPGLNSSALICRELYNLKRKTGSTKQGLRATNANVQQVASLAIVCTAFLHAACIV